MNEKKIFRFTDIGEGLHEGVIQEIKVKIGDVVEEGQNLLSVQTDKVASDLPSPSDGTILAIYIKEGQTVHVGEPMMYIGEAGEKVDTNTIAKNEQHHNQTKSENIDSPKPNTSINEAKNESSKDEGGASVVGQVSVSNKLLKNLGNQNNQNQDYLSHENLQATPLARKTASELRISLSQITGSGINGRIVYDDVLLFQRNRLSHEINNFIKNEQNQQDVAVVVNEFDKSYGITKIRKEIAKSMTKSHFNIPDTTLFFQLDISDVVSLRNQVKYEFKTKNNANLTYLSFFIQAVALTLKKFPIFNSVYDSINEELVYRGNINIGIAIDTSDGLLVPNIKKADEMSISSIAQEIVRLATNAREKKLALKDIQNGTYTITNLGSTGAIMGQPIIYYPQVSIFGLGSIEDKLYLDEDQKLKVKKIMNFSVSADHRWIDGADIGRFANYLKELFDSKFYEREFKNVYQRN